MSSNDRAQDIGRRHRRSSSPSAVTTALLDDFRHALRVELRSLLIELDGTPSAAGLLDVPGETPPKIRPPIGERARLWDLAVKVARELGTEVDPPAPDPSPAEHRGPRRARVDFG